MLSYGEELILNEYKRSHSRGASSEYVFVLHLNDSGNLGNGGFGKYVQSVYLFSILKNYEESNY